MNKRISLRSVTVAAAVMAALVAAFIYLSGPRPENSLESARIAYQSRDAQAFHEYVDIVSILSDWVDQASGAALTKTSGAGEQALVLGAATLFKAIGIPYFAQQVETWLMTGQSPDSSTVASAGATGAYLSGVLHTLATSGLRYQGIAAESRSGTDAILDVNVSSPVSNQPLVVRIRMRPSAGHWRIVAIEDIAGLMRQLHLTPA